MGARKFFRRARGFNTKRWQSSSPLVPVNEAARQLADGLGLSIEQSMELLEKGFGDVPPPNALFSEPKKWRADTLANWIQNHGGKVRSLRGQQVS